MWLRALASLALFSSLAPAQSILPVTSRASTTPAGLAGDKASRHGTLSFDGNIVAFESAATDLVAGDTNGTWDVFVRNRSAGFTERISVGPFGTEANGPSEGAAISDDGRFVAFESTATNLVAGDTGWRDVFLRDRLMNSTTRVSLGMGGVEPNGDSRAAKISPDGGFVLFQSSATNLVPGDTNGVDDVFLYDHQAGTIERVSVSSSGAQANQPSFPASLSSGALKCAFWSDASNLVRGDTNNVSDVFVRNRTSATTERVSLGPPTPAEPAGAQLLQPNAEGSLSASGQLLAYYSNSPDIVPGDTNGDSDIFVRDLATGATELCSKTSLGAPAGGGSYHASLSRDGRFVAFESFADDLTPVGNAWGADAFLFDRATGFTAQVSLASTGQADHVMSLFPAISGDGHAVAFHSDGGQLVKPDGNHTDDVFVHERKTEALLYMDPLVGGSNLSLAITDAPPLGGVVVGWTLAGQAATGSSYGIVDLAAPFFVFFLPTDATGSAAYSTPLPLALVGSSLFLQGLDSNLVLTSTIGRTIQ